MRRLRRFFIRLSVILCITWSLSRFVLPAPEFNDPRSTVLEASDGRLLGARIAADGQWRFPEAEVDQKFEKAILYFEDEYFYYHFGVNPVSIFRALKRNIEAGRVVEGGSTLTMQVARMLNKNKERSISQKLKELFVSLHLEVNYSKKELLKLYASNAPFGGNVVGIEAASWRYFGRASSDLSWAEAATLAVLPNAPSMIYPGMNDASLKKKRDFLLDKLYQKGVINEEEFELAKIEALPGKPLSLPQKAPHFLDRLESNSKGSRLRSTLDHRLQGEMQALIDHYSNAYSSNEVNNAALIIIDNFSVEILAYVGNSRTGSEHQYAVDMIKSPRSTGSTLKPLLYAAMCSSGDILPEQLVSDIPVYFGSYSPKNYYEEFDGAVNIDQALIRSLNVPFVSLLSDFGVERFHHLLKKMGMHSLKFNSDHYGLTLILGGAEISLLELSSMYSGMARSLLSSTGEELSGSPYFQAALPGRDKLVYDISETILQPAAIFETFNAMTDLHRPISREGWKSFSSSKKIAWKTGTSFGNKDAWAIGVTPEYTVAVWVGNSDGEGRAGLTGTSFAAPILFDAYDRLGHTRWFEKPVRGYVEEDVCSKSGFLATRDCLRSEKKWLPDVNRSKARICEYHKLIFIDKQSGKRVSKQCAEDSEMEIKSYFILPPAQEWYFKKNDPLYSNLPQWRDDCDPASEKNMQFLYPSYPNKVYLARGLDGQKGVVVFDLIHRKASESVFWYLDGEFIGKTQHIHQMEVASEKGEHQMLVVDASGNELLKSFSVLSSYD